MKKELYEEIYEIMEKGEKKTNLSEKLREYGKKNKKGIGEEIRKLGEKILERIKEKLEGLTKFVMREDLIGEKTPASKRIRAYGEIVIGKATAITILKEERKKIEKMMEESEERKKWEKERVEEVIERYEKGLEAVKRIHKWDLEREEKKELVKKLREIGYKIKFETKEEEKGVTYYGKIEEVCEVVIKSRRWGEEDGG